MNTKRNSTLEGLRGFSALIVLLGHFCAMFYPAVFFGDTFTHLNNYDFKFGQTPLMIMANGNTGVVVFLLITGYGSYQVFKRGENAVRKFLVMRYFKLLVLVLLSTVGIALLATSGYIFYQQASEITLTTWLGKYEPSNLNYFHSLINDPLLSLSEFNTALWTMKYMFVGAGISVLLSGIIKNQKKSWIIILLAIFVFWNLNEAYYICCILGVLLADTNMISQYYKRHKFIEMVMLLVGVYFAAYPSFVKPVSFWYRFLPWSGQISLYYHIIGALLIMAECVYGELLKPVLDTKPFQVLAKYSSSIYATHIGVIVSLSGFVFLKMNALYSYNCAAGITFAITMICVLILAIAVQYILEFIYGRLDKIYHAIFS